MKSHSESSPTKLKPCPFCGSNEITPMKAYKDSEVRHFPIVRCAGCFAEASGNNCDWSDSAKSAIEAWNRRII